MQWAYTSLSPQAAFFEAYLKIVVVKCKRMSPVPNIYGFIEQSYTEKSILESWLYVN
jgi:hypothetical protein